MSGDIPSSFLVNAVASFCCRDDSTAPLFLSLKATSPAFRVALETMNLSPDPISGLSLKRYRHKEDPRQHVSRRPVLQVSLQKSSYAEKALSLSTWWILRAPSPLIEVHTHIFCKALSPVLTAAFSLSVCRRHAHTINWIADMAPQLESLTCDSLSDVQDFPCLSRLRRLSSLTLNGCKLNDSTWINGLVQLLDLKLLNCKTQRNFIVYVDGLSHLQSLTVHFDSTVIGVSGLRECKRLKVLDLAAQRHTATQFAGREDIAELTELRELRLSGCPLSGASSVMRCKHLEVLKMKATKDTDVCFGLEHTLPSLRVVDVSYSALEDTSFLRDSSLLTALDLRGCTKLRTLSWGCSLANLSCLLLTRTCISDLASLSRLAPCVETLVLDGCKEVRDFTPLGALNALVQLSLRNTNVDDIAWITGCPRVKTLYLSDCENLTSIDPVSFLDNLTVLDAKGTKIQSLAWLNHCPRLELLGLSKCTALDQKTQVETPPATLRELQIDAAADANLEWIGKCTELTTLVMRADSSFTNFDWLLNLRKLQFLNVDSAALTDHRLLRNCENLKWIKAYSSFNMDELMKMFPEIQQSWRPGFEPFIALPPELDRFW